jgi:hypothetical protein
MRSAPCVGKGNGCQGSHDAPRHVRSPRRAKSLDAPRLVILCAYLHNRSLNGVCVDRVTGHVFAIDSEVALERCWSAQSRRKRKLWRPR